MFQLRILAAIALLAACLPGHAQTTASCSYTTFSAPSGGYSWPNPNGINNYGTEVGAVLSPPINTVARWRGLLRYSNGNLTTYNYPGAQDTWFTRRNDAGVTVGDWDNNSSTFHGLIMSGSKVVQVDYPGPQPSTWLYGINKWGSVVGSYVIWPNGNFTTGGFKLQNGKYTQVKYPGANFTDPFAINNNGVVVGAYSNTPFGYPYLAYNGFILQNGTYKTINNPLGKGQNGTQLTDINDGGVIVGNWMSLDSQNLDVPHGFIYKNGVFEALKYPGAIVTSAGGINNYGTVVGNARMPANNGFGYNLVPFKAYCK